MTRKFEMTLDHTNAVVVLRLWNYWTEEEAADYFAAVVQTAAAMHRKHASWNCIVDAVKSPPQSPKTQKIRQDSLVTAHAQGMIKIAYIIASPLTEAQMSRVTSLAGATAKFFNSEGEARRWLATP